MTERRNHLGLSLRAEVLLAAIAIDLLLGELPGPLHPVAWIGTAIDALEARAPNAERGQSLRHGLIATLGLTAASAGFGILATKALERTPRTIDILAVAGLLKPAFALRALIDAGTELRHALERDGIEAARAELRSLVSRDAGGLSAEECAAAGVESLAENTADSFVGPWLAFLMFGLPGAWVFRTINTLDSRWGYRGRYEWLGRTAAVLDDALAAAPARLSAILLIAAAWLTGNDANTAVRTLMRDRQRTPSPNAGWTMAAMAGALRRRLAKPGVYELYPEGTACSSEDLACAQRMVIVAAALCTAALLPSLLPGHAKRRT
jgi:adenosylcobinamide-phosphate synthase